LWGLWVAACVFLFVRYSAMLLCNYTSDKKAKACAACSRSQHPLQNHEIICFGFLAPCSCFLLALALLSAAQFNLDAYRDAVGICYAVWHSLGYNGTQPPDITEIQAGRGNYVGNIIGIGASDSI
jgi:hypothetical protein